MVFVLAIVMYRAVKGQRGEEQDEYSQITIIVDNPNASPPSYLDDKAPIIDETVQAPKSSPPSYVNENYPIVVDTAKAPSTEESK